MRFSIVIPVFKTEQYLPRCLDSLVAQTDGDFETIVVDDASPRDERQGMSAEEIVSRYDSRFRYVRHEKNRSAFQARCTGVMEAKGDFVVPVDPDDYLMSETLAKLRETIDRDAPDIVSYWMDYDDGTHVKPHWCRHPAAIVTGVEALKELVEHKYFTGVASKAFRRETLVRALAKLAPPADTYVNTCDDFLMLVAALMESARVSFLDYAGYRYFVNAASTSFSWRTHAGFLRAREQMRLAGSLLLRMADRPSVSAEVKCLVGEAVAGIEAWFAQMKRESSWGRRILCRLARVFAKCYS